MYSNQYNNSVISNCFNAGLIDASNNTAYSIQGGIVGKVEFKSGVKSDLSASISNSYSIGTIKPTTSKNTFSSCKLGGIVGIATLDAGTLNINNVYYYNHKLNDSSVLKDISASTGNVIKGSNVKGYSLSEMKKKSTFNGFDFDNVWEFRTDEGEYEYPVIREVAPPSIELDDGSAVKGYFGSILWKVSGDTLLLSGSGYMNDLGATEKAPWYEYKEQIVNIVVGNGIKSLGYGCFSNLNNAENITLPNTLEKIGGSAFSGCSSMVSIDIPESVTSIDRWAFSNCKGIEQIVIPNGI